MKEFSHGGDILTAQNIYGNEVLDFSTSLNPLGMPYEVRKAAEESIKESDHYPDPFCRELISAISRRYGIKKEYILIGNGAADLIFRLVFALKPTHAMVLAPTFSEYEKALKAWGCDVLYHQLVAENDFALTEDILHELNENLDLLFLCNPNNPTGSAIDPHILDNILQKCRQKNILLVVDECFIELANVNEGLAYKLEDYQNLILVRAFTKSYSMPGLRLGYCMTSNKDILQKVGKIAQPWSVSHTAQKAGIAAIKLPEYPQKAKELIKKEQQWLSHKLQAQGFQVFPSSANFILFRADGINDLKMRLMAKGILIRCCGNFVGLSDDYYRVSVRQRKDNVRLINAIGRVLN